MVMPKVDPWERIEVRGPDECWPWHGSLSFDGYGRFGKRSLVVHRYVYELFVGPIPEGLEVDHLCHTRDESCSGGKSCRHRRCANPAHLEAVTHKENALRGRSFAAVNAAKTECINGHPFTPENTHIGAAGRRFRKCTSEQQRRYQRRLREKV